MLKICAAFVDVMRTNSDGVRRPVFTPASHTTAMRSSTPPQPFGMRVKSSAPIAFWPAQNVQWSVAVVCRLPPCRPCHSAVWWWLERNGGLIT